ncbi:MAG: hypothetical protein CFE29_08795 [Bradyrhizobiaceae bacterium PARB1]|nr:MAG: hypothetical protein CFE29_08795 [Bradyrhizobiaceae bacterium PARB1]
MRRVVLMFVAFAYLFTGFFHHSDCAHASAVSQSTVVAVSDGGTEKSKLVIGACDHCPTCASALAPDVAKILHTVTPAPMIIPATDMRVVRVAGPDSPPPKSFI